MNLVHSDRSVNAVGTKDYYDMLVDDWERRVNPEDGGPEDSQSTESRPAIVMPTFQRQVIHLLLILVANAYRNRIRDWT
jgi:hypothetical protein